MRGDLNRGARIKDGQVRVPLKGRLDVIGLSKDLKRRGYFLANDPWDTDSQGWSTGYDNEDYYPYWVYRDGNQWVFAFPPEDYQTEEDGWQKPAYGTKAQAEMEYWLPYLIKWCK